MMAIGPSHTASSAETSPTAKKGGRPSSRRRIQLLATNSGPNPAGSPIETASGWSGVASARSAIFDHRVATQVAQVALRLLVQTLLGEGGLNVLRRRDVDLGGIVAAAQDQDAHPF